MKKKEKAAEVNTFFLACELKPRSELWSVIDPFAYDVKPAFIYGSLGIVSYEPEAYSILEINNKTPLMGYIATITHPGTVLLLDKLKGFNGPESFNYHYRKLVNAYTDVGEVSNAWCYLLSDYVLECYSKMEQVEHGIFAKDDDLSDLLEKIENSL